MHIRSRTGIAIVSILAAALAAGCSNEPAPPDTDETGGATSFIGRQAAKGIAEAQRKLETENIRLGTKDFIHIKGLGFARRSVGTDDNADALPKAEITPEGVLLIAGEAVPANARQQELLLAYRGHLLGVAQAGMALGIQGADIAGTALTGIGQALFGGEEGRREYEARIEAEAERIEQEATALCTLLPGLHDSQQALASAMPEFVPYATMTRKDIEDCGKDTDADPTVEPTDEISI
ncbi:hypothetical protein ACW7G2_01455 [Luteimonas sp. A277]